MGCVTLIKLLLLCVNGPQPIWFYWQISDSCSILGVLRCRVQKIYLPLDCGFENCSESALFTYSSFAALKFMCQSFAHLTCCSSAALARHSRVQRIYLQPNCSLALFCVFRTCRSVGRTLSLFAGGHADSSRVRRHFGTYRPGVLDLDLSVAAEDFPYGPF